MEAWAKTLEARLAAAGAPPTRTRSQQVAFHSTIGHYNPADTPAPYPFDDGVAAVNKAVTPGAWTRGAPFGVTKVRCNGFGGSVAGPCPSWHPHPPIVVPLG